MKRCLCLFLLAGLAWPHTAGANGFAHSPQYIQRVNRESFEGAEPEEIARYLAHFSGGVSGGAVAALAAGGEKNLPLVKKLLKDTNPWIRGGAVRVLCAMYAPKREGKKPPTPREITPELKKVMDLVGGMLKDPHPEVQASVGVFYKNVGVENAMVHKVLIAQACDADPRVRSQTAEAIRHWIKDPGTRVRVGMEVLRRPDGVSPHALALGAIYLWQHKDEAREALPVVVRYLNVKAHTIRGFFTNSPYQRGLNLIEHYFDEKLEQSPGVVLAVCRSVVRIPYETYGGWMDARKTAVRIIEKMGPGSAGAVRAAADAEDAWLAASTDDEIRAVTPARGTDVGTPREEAVKRVKYLRDVAAWLEAGKPAGKKPELKHPELKKKPPRKKKATK